MRDGMLAWYGKLAWYFLLQVAASEVDAWISWGSTFYVGLSAAIIARRLLLCLHARVLEFHACKVVYLRVTSALARDARRSQGHVVAIGWWGGRWKPMMQFCVWTKRAQGGLT